MTDDSLVDDSGNPVAKESLRAGLSSLLQAQDYARDARANLWDFAMEIDKLRQAGLKDQDLQWMISRGFVEDRVELTVYGDAHRSFRDGDAGHFDDRTCFVLTYAGRTFAISLANDVADS